MKLNTLFVCCLAATFFAGCKKDKVDVPNANLEGLFDTWELVQRSGGFSGAVETPQSMGYQLSVRYDEDGTVYWYKDGVFATQDQFHFEYQDAAHVPNGTHYTIKYENRPFREWVYIHNDTLYLDGAFCNDCSNYIYIRQ